MDVDRMELKLLALALDYPGAGFQKSLPGLWAAAADLPEGTRREKLTAGLEGLRALPPLGLQECYTGAFDLNPATTLNMTHHLWGDSEQRAAALVRLEQAYRAAGYERSTGELPDFLPLMLEFLAVCPQAPDRDFVWQCLGGLERLVERLADSAPVYAVLLGRLAELRPSSAPGRPVEGGLHEPRG
jgi:nitrate reductase delta subunit